MSALQTRLPCPVCLAVKMEKVRLPTRSGVRDADLVLDHCARCGGVWFEAGEVARLRGIDAGALWKAIVRRDDVHTMSCHSCRALIPRTEATCPACGWKVELDCPECERPMKIEASNGLRLDYCAADKGVWFDHDELTAIWQMEARALVRRGRSRDLDVPDGLEVLLFDPFLLYYGVHAAAHAAGAAGQALASSGAMEAAGGIVEAAGDVASSLFETIAEIIGGIFG
jgi:Zn-finger nucleic acid-binding protein